jgi:hypothetical protein
MKIIQLLLLILMVISCQAKFNSHINQKDLPKKTNQTKKTNSTEINDTAEKSDEKTDVDSDAMVNKEAEEKPYRYQWQAFKGIVFNRDVNPFAKLAKSFSDHKEKRQEKADNKKAKNNSETKLEAEAKDSSFKTTTNNNDPKIKNEEK